MDKQWIYNIWDNPEVTPRGQWIILITDKGLVFSNTKLSDGTAHFVKRKKKEMQKDNQGKPNRARASPLA